MHEQHPSAVSPRRGRGAKLLAGAVALTMGTFGGLTAISALPAFAQNTLTTNSYNIGSPSGAVNDVTISPSAAVSGHATSYDVTFIATAALSGSSNNEVTVTPSATLTNVTAPDLIDTASGCFQGTTTGAGGTGTATGATLTTGTGLEFFLTSSCSIAAGQTVEIDFTAVTTASSFDVTVSSSDNGTSVASNTVTVSSAPPTLSAGSETIGANAEYTIDNIGTSGAQCAPAVTETNSADTTPTQSFPSELSYGEDCGWAGLSQSVTQLVLVSTLTATGTGTPIAWDGAGAFSVTYTPSGGTATADTIGTVAVTTTTYTNDTLTLTLDTAVPAGDTINVEADATNPPAATDIAVVVIPMWDSTGGYVGDPNNATTATTPTVNVVPTELTGEVTFGTSVTAVTSTISPLVGGASATYVMGFKANLGVSTTQSITLEETTGPTDFASQTGVLVSDSTANWHYVAPTADVLTSENDAAIPAGELVISGSSPLAGATPLPDAINGGDVVTVTVAGVTNPGNATYSDLDVFTSTDTVAVAAPPYTLGASGSYGINVTVNPVTPSAIATYTITNLSASEAMAAGSTIVLTADSGTVMPQYASYYTVTDTTTPSGSGTATNAVYLANPSCTGCTVEITLPNAITSGDALTLTIGDVFNPGTGSYTIQLYGDLGAPSAIAPFPHANVTYPNGALVNFAGTIYVFAGGHPFGIPTPTILSKIQAVDKATVMNAVAGAVLPTVAARTGTLITTNAVNGTKTIYVVGTDGQLHGFVTPASFTGDGYDAALTITVPNLGGITVGSTASVEGSAVTALATGSDGAIVDSSGTYYVFDGGKAFGVPTPKALTAVRKADTATPISGSVGTIFTGATIASGVLLTAQGIVYLAYVGKLFPFKSMNQLKNDGYSGTASVTSWNVGGISVVSAYSGS